MEMESVYELPSKFYLGKEFDLGKREILDQYMLYDSKDLVTHALCVGMTGSGKTGLCLSLLEEAAIDGIPVICIDPKGDLGNLMLTFPELRGEDFSPWVDPAEANQKNQTTAELGESYAQIWRKGLGKWEQAPTRIARYRDSVDITIYTPGSTVGVPLTVLKSFDAPAPEVIADGETFREKITSAASGMLTLLGISADPLTSREHILLSKILETAWTAGKNLSLADIIRHIQTPPIDRVGVIDIESFFPTAQRAAFAMSLNNLLASPAFAGWLEGEPLNVKKLLYTDEGKPRLSILSISHLSDSERMFFVTLFLGELLGWMRAQPGTGSLRAIFYMDEVYGYFPPSAKPPSKPPMLTLLKQARAFGLGIMLATQNPVDLDYKGLSNIGTWFLGRLQTDRDKQRVLDGLEGAAAQTGGGFNRAAMEQTLAALGSRVFLMNNVYRERPVIFQSRWALSFLRGPLSREQVSALMKTKRDKMLSQRAPAATSAQQPATATKPMDTTTSSPPVGLHSERPIVQGDVTENFWVQSRFAGQGGQHVYMPAVLGKASIHFVKTAVQLDDWQDVSVISPICDRMPQQIWSKSFVLPPGILQLSKRPEEDLEFGTLQIELATGKNYKAWQKELQDYLYRTYSAVLFYSPALDRYSRVGESEMDVRIEFSQDTREARDSKVAELEKKYAMKLSALQSKYSQAKDKLSKEQGEAKGHFYDSVVTVGTSILGALIGRKAVSKTNLTKVSSAARNMTRVSAEQADVDRAQEKVDEIETEIDGLGQECEAEVDAVKQQFKPESLRLEKVEVPCRKGDMQVAPVSLLWIPFQRGRNGILAPLVELPDEVMVMYR